MIDLVILVADRSIEAAVRGLLSRPDAIGIRPLTYEIVVHPNRDPGCFHSPDELLDGYRGRARHALVILDRGWQGVPANDARELERMIEERLNTSAAPGWARTVVIDPELEAWVFSDSPHVANTLGWSGTTEEMRNSLQIAGLWPHDLPKPPDPKQAMERLVRKAGVPRSSSLYRRLASRVSFQRCQDPAFLRLLDTLREWFGANKSN